jgi:hypothetical protein
MPERCFLEPRSAPRECHLWIQFCILAALLKILAQGKQRDGRVVERFSKVNCSFVKYFGLDLDIGALSLRKPNQWLETWAVMFCRMCRLCLFVLGLPDF